MKLDEILQRRYATKVFDPTRTLPEPLVSQLLDVLRWSPSSTNLQPWHFIVAGTDEGKARLARGATADYAYNERKLLDCSHAVLLCSYTRLDDAHFEQVLQAEEQAGRFAANPAMKDSVNQTRRGYHDYHLNVTRDVAHWNEKQLYLNLGCLLLGAGVLGVDALPIEGLDLEVLNAEFDLPARGLSAQVAVALGYRAADDFNAGLPKGRLPADHIITRI